MTSTCEEMRLVSNETSRDTPIQKRYVSQISEDLERNRRQQEELNTQLQSLYAEESWLSGVLTLARGDRAGAKPTKVGGEGTTAVRRQPRGSKSGAQGRRGSRPPLGALILQILSGHSEPQTVTAVHGEVVGLQREASQQVVRNALEALVAKGRVERHKGERNVMYVRSPRAEEGVGNTGDV